MLCQLQALFIDLLWNETRDGSYLTTLCQLQALLIDLLWNETRGRLCSVNEK